MMKKKKTTKKTTAKKATKAARKTPAKIATKKARLGRGLSALLGEVRKPGGGAALRSLPITQLQRGVHQPRIVFEPQALDELAESIKNEGIIQPLVVREIADAKFEIIAGERRWRAAQRAGVKSVPVVVREIDDKSAMAVALIENIQRENLNAIEEANGLQKLTTDYELTHEQVAKMVGKTRAVVTNLLRLLKLNAGVKKLVEERKLDMGHARELVRLPADKQTAAAARIVSQDLNVRQTEALVKNMLGDKGAVKNKSINADTSRLQEKLSARLGAEVKIIHRDNQGKVIIRYHSLDELDGIIAKIK